MIKSFFRELCRGNRSFEYCVVLSLMAAGLPLLPRQAAALELTWNGFASEYAILPLQKDIYLNRPEVTNGSLNFTDGSLLGLNLRGDMGEGWSMMVQLLVSGTQAPGIFSEPDWKPRADWFYLVYNPLDGLTFKLGRQIFPNWLLSEFIDVGVTYPWRRPPNYVYSVSPFKAFNGATAEYRYQMAHGMSLTGSLFGGSEKISGVYGLNVTSNIELNDLVGATITLDGDGWRVRGMGGRYRNQGSNQVLTINPKTTVGTSYFPAEYAPFVTIYTIGARYDKHNIVGYAEYGHEQSRGASVISSTGIPYGDRIWGTYGSLGYRLGRLLPWYMYTYADWHLGFNGADGKTAVNSAGLNFQATPSVVVKAQYDRQETWRDSMALNKIGTADTLSAGVDLVF